MGAWDYFVRSIDSLKTFPKYLESLVSGIASTFRFDPTPLECLCNSAIKLACRSANPFKKPDRLEKVFGEFEIENPKPDVAKL